MHRKGTLTQLLSAHPLAAQRALPRGQERRGAALGARCTAMSRTRQGLYCRPAPPKRRSPRLAGPGGSLRWSEACSGADSLISQFPGAEGDLGKVEQAASLAEPAYTPPGGTVALGGVLEDLLEEALRETDAVVLCRLKAVRNGDGFGLGLRVGLGLRLGLA